MGYPEKLLNPGEYVAVDVVPHWKYMARPAAAVVLALAGAIVALQLQPPRWAELAIAGVMVLSLLWLVERYLRWVDHFVRGHQPEAHPEKRDPQAVRSRDHARPAV